MRVDNEYRNRPIEPSNIVLGIVAGAAICIFVALLTIDFLNNGHSFFLYELAESMSR